MHEGTSRAIAPRMMLQKVASVLSFVLLSACTSTVIGEGTSSGGTGNPDDSSGTTAGGGSSFSQPKDPSGSSEYDALFGAPETTTLTENSLGGLWAGEYGSNDMRLRITASSLTLAIRCTSEPGKPTFGTEIALQASSTSFRILESKDVSSPMGYCSLQARPLTLTRCETDYDSSCFYLSGTTLTFNASSSSFTGSTSDFVKLSD